MKLTRKYIYGISGIAAGAIAGWVYWYFAGCADGTCAITSKPMNSMLYGGLTGVLLFSSLRKEK